MEEAYKFGCGRYIQEAGALLRIGEEAKRFGKKALILGKGIGRRLRMSCHQCADDCGYMCRICTAQRNLYG